jgi:tetratricopeptide (TPR) repeat protein
MKTKFALVFVLLASLAGYSQQAPAKQAPAKSVAPGAQSAKPQAAEPAQKSDSAANTVAHLGNPDRAAAYYHYSMAHIYEELVAMYGQSEFANKALEEYKLAIENDPDSRYLNAGMAELYAKTGRIRDAVIEAQGIIKRDPNNLEAHRLLGRIYWRSLGDMQAGAQSQQMLKLAIEQYQEILRLDPKSVDDHLLLGRLYRTDNQMQKAESEFKAAAQIQPDSEEAVTSLAYLYNEEGDSARAAAALNAVPEAARTAKHYSALGYTYEQQKDFKKAVDAYRKSVDLDKDNLDALRGLAQNLLNDGQTDAALDQYRSIAEADPQDAQAQVNLAEIYRRNLKYDQALDSLKKAEAIVGGDSLEIPYKRALVYEAQGRFDDAAQLVQQLLQRTTKTSGSYSPGEKSNRGVFLDRLGNIYKEAGKSQLAIETFRKLIDSGGDDDAVRGYDQLIEAYRDNKQWKEATAVAQEAVSKNPQNRALKLVLAGQLADVGKGDEALAQTRALLKGDADDREIYVALSQIELRLKRFKESEDDIDKALQLSSKDEEKNYVLYIQGSILEREKKFDGAEEVFKRVVSSDPQNSAALNYLGYMLADRGVRLEEALQYIKKAAQLDPQNGAYLDSLGWVYFKLGKYELAEENLRKASERMGNDATIQDHLGELFSKTGRLKLAAAHWERALDEWSRSVAADVDTADVARVQKKLESTKVRLAKEGSGSNNPKP